MEIQFGSQNHVTHQPNYRVRHFRTSDNTLARTDLFAFAQTSVVPSTTPPVYRVTNVPKPAGPHTSDYYVTIEAETQIGNSGPSAPSAPYSLALPAAPETVVVVNPLI